MSKSSKHQSTNTFKFESFHERIKKVDPTVGIKLGKHLLQPQDADTHFAEALAYWTDINCTQNFVDFQREIVGRVQSHSQLLYYKDEVAQILLKHLEVPNTMALQALLDLVIQLARDLQDDFLVYFESFFKSFIRQLNVRHHDVDALEWIFTCLAMLLKFLWRYLVKDLSQIYCMISPLLSSSQYRDYINSFAAESFSYLTRKAKNKSELFDLIFASLKTNSDQVDGVGRLLYEMIKKSHHQFFYCTNEVIALLLDKLCCTSDAEGLVTFEPIKKMWTLTTEHLNVSSSSSSFSEQTSLVMCAMLKSLSKLQSEWQAGNCGSGHQFSYVLQLIDIWIGYHNGILIVNQGELVQLLVKLMGGRQLPPEGRHWLLKVTSTFLMSTAVEIELCHRSDVLAAVYKSGYGHLEVFEFTKSLFGISLFEKDVLPGLIGYCQGGITDETVQLDNVLCMFISLLLHKSPPSAGFATSERLLHPYTIDFRPEIKRNPAGKNRFPLLIVDQLNDFKTCLPTEYISLASMWATVRCLPHVIPINTELVVPLLAELFCKISGSLTGDLTSLMHRDMLLSVAEEVMKSLCFIVGAENLHKHISIEHIEKLLLLYPSSIPCLQLVDLFVTCVQTKKHAEIVLPKQLFERIYPRLELNLSSPFSLLRMLSLHIMCQFPLPLPLLPPDVEVEQRGIFHICLDAEMSCLSALTDRIRLSHLRKLDQEYVHHQLNVGISDQMPLRFLIGQLYVNFAPLWGPVRTLIKSYAFGLSRDNFWGIYGPALNIAAEQIVTALTSATNFDSTLLPCEVGELFCQYQQLRAGTPDRPDYGNFRQQLWMAMQEFPADCEPRSKIIVPLFLNFLENEYFPSDSAMAKTQDLRITSNVVDDDDEVLAADNSNARNSVVGAMSRKRKKSALVSGRNSKAIKRDGLPDEMEEEISEDEHGSKEMEISLNNSIQKSSSTKKKVKTASDKVLLVHLNLFSKFRDPKSLVQQNRLHEIYLELLKSKSPAVQKAVFDCIMTYKHKYLVPYRENIERLIDEKSFRHELVVFNSAINEVHREDLVPVLMRILYGKMRLKAGRDASNSSLAQARKSTIMAFIASAPSSEIEIFFNLVFQPFQQLFLDDIERQIVTMLEDLDVSQVIPLRKQQSVLDTVSLVMHKFGTLAGFYLPRLLQIIVGVTASCAALLNRRSEIQLNHVNLLKSLRQKALAALAEFFTSFESYSYSKAEIEAVFMAAVWPQLDKLSVEGVYSPTPLLRLFHVWSQSRRYVVLLSKYRAEQPDVTPLSRTFSLLRSKNTTADTVIALVMNVIDNLLSWDDMDMLSEDVEPILANSVATEVTENGVPYGTWLLLPHVPVILHFLHGVVKKFSSSGTSGHGKFRAPPAVETSILSRLSEYVTDRSQSVDIVNLLLPFLGRRLKRSEEFEVNLLTCMKNLIGNCEMPAQLIPKLSELFSVLSANLSRKALCEVLMAIGSCDSTAKAVAVIASNLNAWDARYVEEPDLSTRMEAFSEANQLLTSDKSLDINLLLVLVHNCTFLIATLDGLSGFALRDQSMECLDKIIERIARDTDENFSSESYRIVIVRHLLTEVKTNLRLKSESGRNAFIAVLESLVRNFPTASQFSDLVQLRNDSDIETDFFKNIVHVQLHRRMKALRFLGRCFFKESVKSVKTETLVNYILPMVTSLLRDPIFIKNSDRVDVAVETLGLIVHHLPWPRYLIVLRYYLGETLKALETQKISIKILTAVLDNFHFNLQDSQFTASNRFLVSGTKRVAAATETMVKAVDDATEAVVEAGNDTDPVNDTNDIEMADDGEPALDDEVEIVKDVCTPALATRIHRVIEINILPQLHKCLTKESKTDGSHKLAVPGKYAEDEEILRVPVALAMVKLLQRLPQNALEKNLPSVLLKVCRFLCSRSRDIRISARDTLTKIVRSLGPTYFSYVLNEMSAALKRGYQLHVLCYSVWSILKNMQPTLKPGDLDSSIVKLTEVLNTELFGQVSDEKDVEGIFSKLFEAKTTKSIDSYGILATVVSSATLTKLISPLQAELLKTRSNRVTKKIADVLKLIGRGLIENKGLERDTLMTFMYGLASEAATNSTEEKPAEDFGKKSKASRRQPSVLLIKPEPGRIGKKPKSKSNANSHILVDFGLQLLHLLLKRSHISVTSKSDLQLLDPFVSILSNSLSSKYVKVTSAALRCLTWVLRMPLPSIKAYITPITSQLFVLLSNYAGAGAGKGDNFEMVVMCFKAITVLVRDVTSHKITEKQLHVLLVYAKQDLNDFSRQATAFSVLKAIISRKLVAPEMEDIIREVERMSIVCEATNIQQQCRQIAWQFMLDYPLGRKLAKHLEFYLQQLQFEYESGRVCALEMLSTIFNTFPQSVLNEYAGLFFTSVAARVVNDDSTVCRQMAAAAIKLLLNKLDDRQRDVLFDLCVQWMQSVKSSLLTLSAKIAGLFAEAEGTSFRRHIATILPLIEKEIDPHKYKEGCSSDREQHELDLKLFDFLTLLLTTIHSCSDEQLNVCWSSNQWSDVINRIWESVEIHLVHCHDWIKLVSSQLFNELFSSSSVDCLVSTYLQNTSKTVNIVGSLNAKKVILNASNYLTQDLWTKLRDLFRAFCKQLSCPNLTQQLGNEVVTSLLHVTRILSHLSQTDSSVELSSIEPKDKRLSMLWMIKRVVREIKTETSGFSKTITKRRSVYMWLLGVATILGSDGLPEYLYNILRPLVREVTDNSPNADATLKTTCQDTLETVKQLAGSDEFSRQYAAVQQALNIQRQERKTLRSVEAVTNPALSARRKIKKNVKKKEAKKRKIASKRPSKNSKRMKIGHEHHVASGDSF